MMRNIHGHSHLTRIALFAGLLTLSGGLLQAQKQALKTTVPANPDARMVAHVLDRIGFGARPGDVARIQDTGLAAYIEQQLHPERIADGALKARLSEFPTISLKTSELADEYFNPADQARRLQQQQQARAQAMDPTMSGGAAAGAPPPPPNPNQPQQPPSPEQRMLQQKAQSVTNELMQAKLLRASMSDRQLEEVLVDFWFNHFNVFIGKGQVRQYLTEYERDAIRPYVLGDFRDMLGATAHSPAMLFYLDNFQSRTPTSAPQLPPGMQERLADPRLTPQQRQQIMQRAQQQPLPRKPQGGLNENYGRELMELHTLGVDAGYTQQDVIDVARILTGWTIDRPQQGGGFVYRPQMHDEGTKIVLGKTFKSDGQQEGEHLLDMLAMHPKTAHHIAYKLAQRFVADEPPAELVDRAAKKFLETKGNLREVTRVIITSPEFFDPKYFAAKVKTPLEFVISAVRATNANVVTALPMVQALQQLGMPLYGAQPPTGYSMTADAWVNTGALVNRMNFAQQLVNGGVPQNMGPGPGRGGPGRAGQPGPPPDGQQPPQRPIQGQGQGRGQQQMDQQLQRQAQITGRGPLQVDVRALAPDTSEASIDRALETLISGGVSDATRQIIGKATTPQQVVALALGSPEFQKR